MKDLFGKALLDYQNGNYTEDLVTWTNISEEDVLPLAYLFRAYKDMPQLEKKALALAKGRVLDIGAGAGSHSLYLQEQGFVIKAIDLSEGAIAVCKARGVKQAELYSFLDETESFDTVLLLMNGTGLFQNLESVNTCLTHLKSLLNPGGQILIDSSDIKYMYADEDGGFWEDMNANYYGELDYFLSYKNEKEVPLKWLYLDIDTLTKACHTVGLTCDIMTTGAHYDYLAKLSLDASKSL